MALVVGGGKMSGPADPIKDKDGEPIHPSEGYRRAKRNVLFWGAATTLLAFGTVNPSETIEINALVRHLSFDHGLLVFSSLIVLIFMIFGYWRADQQLIARHSGFALAHRMEELVTVVQKMIDDMRSVEEIASSHLEILEQQKLAISEAGRLAIAFIESSPIIHPAMAQDVLKSGEGRPEWNIQPPQLKELASVEFLKQQGSNLTQEELLDAAISANASVIQGAAEWMQGLLVEWLRIQKKGEAAFFASLPAHDASESAMTTVNSKFEELKDLPAMLSGFATKIGAGERRWFWLFDRLPVATVALLGTVSAVWHLKDPQSLASIVTFWF